MKLKIPESFVWHILFLIIGLFCTILMFFENYFNKHIWFCLAISSYCVSLFLNPISHKLFGLFRTIIRNARLAK